MKRILHIVASPRGDESRTLKLSTVLIQKLQGIHEGIEIDTLNLFEKELPVMGHFQVDGKYELMSGKQLTEKNNWDDILSNIDRFKKADIVIISSPMWNFTVPYKLKHYLDVILQPGYMFKYTENGPEGLIKGKKAYIVTTKGGDYSGEAAAFNKLEPYLEQVLRFIGFEDITHITAQPMDATDQKGRAQNLQKAVDTINAIFAKA